MLAQANQLAQLRPTPTTPVLAYTASVDTEITLVVICNTTAADANFSVYHDDDGTIFDDDTALYKLQLVPARDTIEIELSHAGAGISVASGGSIAVASDTADAINFTLYGITTRITGQF